MSQTGFRKNIVLCHPVRTALGDFGGSLKNVKAVDLGATVIKEVLKRSRLSPDLVDSAIMGNVIQAGNKMNPARQAAIYGGLPNKTPALAINRVCGSGAQAVFSAALEIEAGTASIVMAGGMENMDQSPYLLGKARFGYRMGNAEVIDSMLEDGLNDAFSGQHSGWHTEDLAARYKVSREEQDRFSVRSHHRFSAAQAAGKFNAEIVPVEIPGKKPVIFDKDEHNRPDASMETLAKLRPAFRKDGTITAGNAPGLNSGAAAMIVTDLETAKKHNLVPMARLVSAGVSGVDPDYFGLGPIEATKIACQRAGWALSDIERIEINEAFAVIAYVCYHELGLNEDIVNVEGGAVAHGHPIGATGAILTTRLLHSMQRDKIRKGVVTLCIGGGQGIALTLEAL